MGFSERLKSVIKRSGLKREDFAEKAGKSRTQIFKYLGGEQNPTADFFQAVKDAFPWVNIEWLITGVGEMEAQPQSVRMVATGNGNVQANGRMEIRGKGRVGGVHAGRDMITVQEGQTAWQSQDRDLIEVVELLRDYGTPKLIAELRSKLLQVKNAVEG